MTRGLKLIAIAILFSCIAFAQQGGPSVDQITTPTVIIHPGRTATATLQFRVAGSYHINSNKPLDELLLPTKISLNPPSEIMISKVTYPEGQLLNFPFSPETKLSVYSGDFKVTTLLRAAQSVPRGTFRVHGELKYQACNDRQCFPPKKLPIYFDVKVVKAKR